MDHIITIVFTLTVLIILRPYYDKYLHKGNVMTDSEMIERFVLRRVIARSIGRPIDKT